MLLFFAYFFIKQYYDLFSYIENPYIYNYLSIFSFRMIEEDPNKNKSRDFVCSCNKSYLSYAALFTHIKQKHGGKAPGPIVRPRSQNKRGRPRKKQFDISMIQNKNNQSDSNSKKMPIEKNRSISAYDGSFNLQPFLSGNFLNRQCQAQGGAFSLYQDDVPYNNNLMNRDSMFRGYYHNLNRGMGYSPSEFSLNSIIENVESQKYRAIAEGLKNSFNQTYLLESVSVLVKIQKIPVIRQLQQFKHPCSIVRYDEENSCYEVRMGDGIAEFMRFARSVLHDLHYQQLYALILVLLQYFADRTQETNSLYKHYVHQISQFISNFLQEGIDQYAKRFQLHQLWIFQIGNPIKILIWLFNWLSVKQYTYYRVRMNSNYCQVDNSKQTQAQQLPKQNIFSIVKQQDRNIQ